MPMKWCFILNFKFQLLIAGIKESNWLLHINLVSYNLAINYLLFPGVFVDSL